MNFHGSKTPKWNTLTPQSPFDSYVERNTFSVYQTDHVKMLGVTRRLFKCESVLISIYQRGCEVKRTHNTLLRRKTVMSNK